MPQAQTLEKLAIDGGPKAKSTPYGTGKRFGPEELAQLKEALDQQTLFYAKGSKTKTFRERFAARYGVKHVVTCSSGTAALHIAVAAAGIKPGDEVITASITDMGTCIAILQCGAIPVFADLDPHSYTMDPAAVEQLISKKTAAILPVHLTGAPCDMDAFKQLAARRSLKLIEDCAQSYHTGYKRQLCGTIGDAGCFSLNDFKHISAGDAGMVLTNDDELAHRAELFADKCYDRAPNAERNPFSLAMNYRMCELHAAVALAQLEKLDGIIAARRRFGDGLHAGLEGLPGIVPQRFVEGARPSYWFYLLRIDEKVLGPRDKVAEALAAEGLRVSAGYVPYATYLHKIFRNRSGFGGTEWPFSLAPHIRYEPGLCPNAEAICADCIQVGVNEFYTDEDLAQTLAGFRKVATQLAARS